MSWQDGTLKIMWHRLFYRWRYWKSRSKILTQMFTNRHRPGVFWSLRWVSFVKGFPMDTWPCREMSKGFRYLTRSLEETFFGQKHLKKITLLKWPSASSMSGASSRDTKSASGKGRGVQRNSPWVQKAALPSQPCHSLLCDCGSLPWLSEPWIPPHCLGTAEPWSICLKELRGRKIQERKPRNFQMVPCSVSKNLGPRQFGYFELFHDGREFSDSTMLGTASGILTCYHIEYGWWPSIFLSWER